MNFFNHKFFVGLVVGIVLMAVAGLVVLNKMYSVRTGNVNAEPFYIENPCSQEEATLRSINRALVYASGKTKVRLEAQAKDALDNLEACKQNQGWN